MKHSLKLAFATLATIGLTGCASIAGDNTRSVQVNSMPAGATVLVDNQEYGTTPTVVTMPSYIYGGKTVVVRKKGYNDQAMQVNTAFQPIALLDILFWPSLIVDGATGSIVKIDPATRNLNAHLSRA
jgi:hypothetical protein